MKGTEVSKMIRKELKMAFPKQKFSVKTGGGCTSTAIRVNWNDGIARNRVQEKLWQFEKIDRCQASGEILSGGNTFIFPERSVSEKHKERITKGIKKKWGDASWQDKWQRERMIQDKVWEKLNKTDF